MDSSRGGGGGAGAGGEGEGMTWHELLCDKTLMCVAVDESGGEGRFFVSFFLDACGGR